MSCQRHMKTIARTLASGTCSPGTSQSLQPNASMVNPETLSHQNIDTVQSFNDMPGPRGMYRLPLVGTMLLFKPFSRFTPTTIPQLFEYLIDRYGPIVRVNLGKPSVLITDPSDLETLMTNEGKYPRRPPFGLTRTYNSRNGVRDGLGDADGPEWQRLRSPLNRHLLKTDSASYYLESQCKVATQFAETLASQSWSPEEAREWFFRYSSESIGLVCFNTRLGLMESGALVDPGVLHFLEATKSCFVQIQKVLSGKSLLHGVYRNRTYREYEKANSAVRKYGKEKLQKAIKTLEDKTTHKSSHLAERNLLAGLIAEKDLDFDDVENMMITLYVAGMESTAKNLQGFFYTLAKHPHIQDKLYKEIISVLGEDGTITADTFTKMPYLKACVRENFRIRYPTMTGPARILEHDTVMGGYNVPAGVNVLPCNPITCRTLFFEGDKYIPERWLRSQEDRKLAADIPRMACLPFGYGPRNCIGRRFAEQEIYLATIKTLQKARIEIDPLTPETTFTYSVFIQPANDISFRFIPRHKEQET